MLLVSVTFSHRLEECKWFYKVQGSGKSAFPRLQLAGEIQNNPCGIQLPQKSFFLSQVLQVFITVLINKTTESLVCLFSSLKRLRCTWPSRWSHSLSTWLLGPLVFENFVTISAEVCGPSKKSETSTFFSWHLPCVWEVVTQVVCGISWQDELFPVLCVWLAGHCLACWVVQQWAPGGMVAPQCPLQVAVAIWSVLVQLYHWEQWDWRVEPWSPLHANLCHD